MITGSGRSPEEEIVYTMGFSGGLDGKESTCNVGDLGLIPKLGRSPWRRAWQPTPVFLPAASPWTEKPVHGVTKSQMTEQLSTAQRMDMDMDI